jgi:hypothetical protein
MGAVEQLCTHLSMIITNKTHKEDHLWYLKGVIVAFDNGLISIVGCEIVLHSVALMLILEGGYIVLVTSGLLNMMRHATYYFSGKTKTAK